MSRPSPVEPPPLTPAAQHAGAGRAARALRRRRSAARRRPAAGASVTANAVPSGVCANTLPSKASSAAARSSAGHRDRQRARRQVERARPGRCPRPAPTRTPPARATTAVASQPAAAGSAPRRRACWISRGDRPLARASTPAPIRAASCRVAQRLGLQPQRGQRRAQPVRQVGDRLPLLAQQVLDPAGQVVQRAGHLAHLGRAGRGRRGRSGRRRPAGATPRTARRSARTRRAGQPVGDQQARAATSATPERGQQQPGPADAAASARRPVTNVRTTAGPPGPALHRRPRSPGRRPTPTVSAAPGARPARTAGVRGAGRAEHRRRRRGTPSPARGAGAVDLRGGQRPRVAGADQRRRAPAPRAVAPAHAPGRRPPRAPAAPAAPGTRPAPGSVVAATSRVSRRLTPAPALSRTPTPRTVCR